MNKGNKIAIDLKLRSCTHTLPQYYSIILDYMVFVLLHKTHRVALVSLIWRAPASSVALI